MKNDALTRGLRAFKLAIGMASLITPRNILRVRGVVKLRSRRDDRLSVNELVQKYGEYTRSQFEIASSSDKAICVIIPCRNEERRLPSTLMALSRSRCVIPVVVDNNSNDNTGSVAAQMGAIVIKQPTGNKMAATQRGILYARKQMRAKRVLFTDGDTMPVADWAKEMDNTLQTLDKGKGAAVFGQVVYMFGPSRLADLAATWLNFMYALLRNLRGEPPIARGGNYGISFDDEGVIEQTIAALDKDLFYAVPDDMQTLMAIQKTEAAIDSASKGNTWVVTDNDRLTSLKAVSAMLKPGISYTDIAQKSYAKEYGHKKIKVPQGKAK